jgi:hypothetical protein
MNAGDLEEHRARRPPKPDVAAENATDGAAIAKLERDAPDVLKTLQKITKPTLLREIAPMPLKPNPPTPPLLKRSGGCVEPNRGQKPAAQSPEVPAPLLS